MAEHSQWIVTSSIAPACFSSHVVLLPLLNTIHSYLSMVSPDYDHPDTCKMSCFLPSVVSKTIKNKDWGLLLTVQRQSMYLKIVTSSLFPLPGSAAKTYPITHFFYSSE